MRNDDSRPQTAPPAAKDSRPQPAPPAAKDSRPEAAPPETSAFRPQTDPPVSDDFRQERTPSTNRKTGVLGERLAALHLETLGFRILARNLKVGRLGELDLVAWAEDGRTMCFVEVKTRTSDRFGTPAESVTFRKQTRIRKMAGAWLSFHTSSGGTEGLSSDIPIRFDVVEVMLERVSHSARVHHIPNAF